MIARVTRAAGTVIILVMMAAAGPRAQLPSSTGGSVPFLDVPYIPQSEALCGGAAAAMVMRYWGAAGIDAETFASLLDAKAGGIHGADLVRDLKSRGWDALAFAGDAALLSARLRARQPVIALIEDRPGAFHYVVIVAWANRRVVLHDSARAPFRVVSEPAFDAAWQKSGRWSLLVLPPKALAAPAPPNATGLKELPPNESPRSPCDALVAQALAAIDANDQPAAVSRLEAATQLCPADSAPPRELAGVYALQEKWADAASHATEAVRRNPNDEHAWRILATSQFILGDTSRALSAWNHLGEPVIDIVNVQGLDRTRYLAVYNSMRLRAGDVLGAGGLLAAGRRLAAVPSSQVSRVTYRPLENGRAAVDAVMIERPRFPLTAAAAVSNAVSALADREVSAAIANPTGAGDLVSASWRWWDVRPMIALAYSAPTRFGGVLRTDLFRDEQSYTDGSGEVLSREVRRGGGLKFSDWSTHGFRWEIGLGAERWAGRGRTVNVSAGIDSRHLDDRVSINAGVLGLRGEFRAASVRASAAWRSRIRNDGSVLLSSVGAEVASGGAPRALWPGAGTGYARPVLLRAHPLLEDGVIAGDVFGRRLYHGSIEWRRWWPPFLRVMRAAPALFVDAARAERRVDEGSAWHVDAGAGLRISVPGSGVLRIDLGKGLRGGSTALSIGWVK